MRPEGTGRRRRSGDPVRVGEVLSSAAVTVGVSPALAALITDFDAWGRVVGADIAGSGRPVRFTDGELVVVAGDKIGETRLRYAAEAVRLAVNEHLGHDEVGTVVVRRPDTRP